MYIPDIKGSKLRAVMIKLLGNERVSSLETRLPASDGSSETAVATSEDHLPRWVGGPESIDESSVYDLFVTDFDLPKIEKAIGHPVKAIEWRSDENASDYIDTTLVWKSVEVMWPC